MFLSIKQCIELYKNGVAPESGAKWVFCSEETSFDEFDLNGDIDAQLEEAYMTGVQLPENSRELFDEFTRNICPAYLDKKALKVKECEK